jgi:hypothetical protein
VIRSSARTRMVCHGTWTFQFNTATRMIYKGTYAKLDKLHSARTKTKPRDSRKHSNESN